MFHPKLWLTALFTCLAAECAISQEEIFQPDTNNPPPIHTEIRTGETVGLSQVRRAYVTIGTNLFVFIVPTGFQLDASNPEKMVIATPTAPYFITIRVDRAISSEGRTLDSNAARNLAQSRFPQASLASEESELALDRSGPAYEFNWTLSGTRQHAFVVYIPTRAGTLEFSAVGNSDRSEESKMILTILLSSLRSDENGGIKIVPLPDHS